jgi:TolB-like protein/tetratricopeptide (TPR) repeat protein
MSFFGELKRRNVYRVAALYIIVSWVVLQVVDVFTSFMPLPEWTSRLVFVLLAAGFPIALVLAWAIELTPDGIKLEKSPPGDQPAKRSDWLIYAALAVVIAIVAWNFDWQKGGSDPATTKIRSLAVLPLDNLMNDPDQAYFVEGLHEALITELSRIEALRIISRTSAMKYQDSGKSVPEIGAELGVDAIIEGSVLRAGETVRVTAQLIDARTDQHLWADNFDRELTDILGLYADVTRNIATSIRVSLSPEESARLEAEQTVDVDAYDAFLKGNHLCDRWTPEDMRLGVELMREAVRIDADNALYRAQLAQCLQYASFYDYVLPVDVHDEANVLVREAVRLDSELSEAWAAYAAVSYYLDYDVVGSRLALERAIELNPSNARAMTHYSWLLGEDGDLAQALTWAKRAIELDPLSPIVRTAPGQAFYLSRDFNTALVEYRKLLEMDPEGPSSHFYVAWALEQLGRHDEAIEHHQRAVELSGSEPLFLAGLGYTYGLAGMTAEAQDLLQQLIALEARGEAGPIHLAMVHVGLGNIDETISWLDKAIDARQSHVVYLKQDAKFDPLRNDPRFAQLLHRAGW